jgi:glycosyltransferase involved in cell wall biosynthesis
MKRISIISPCFNEEENVRACRDTIRALFEGPLADYEREHIFADNCSTDGTAGILAEMAGEDRGMKVVLNARNFGPSRSTFNALRHATGDAVIIFMPVDMQDPPAMIPEFVKLWEAGAEVVAGARANRQESLLLRGFRKSFYWIVNTLSDIDIPMNVGDFQLIDRKVWTAVMQHDDQYPYIRGIVASVGFKRVIVPYTWEARKQGLSKNNFPRLVDQALNGIFAFTNAPMRLCSFIGIALAALCILYAMVAAAAYFFYPQYAPRGITTLIVSFFFLSGMQILFIGLLGEYVTAIHAQVRRGPIVVERERLNFDDRADAALAPAPSVDLSAAQSRG